MSQVIDFVNRPSRSEFCETPAALDILGVLALTQDLRDIGVVVGAPGVGKTTTLRWYADNNRNVHYSVMSPARASMSSVLQLICEAVGVVPAQKCRELHEVLCNWSSWNADQLLIIDEAQHLNDLVLDELRCIHDETGLALVFAGNNSLRSRFNNARAASFAQFTSRIGPRVELERPTVHDVQAIAHHNGVHDPAAIKFLERRIGGHAGLRHVADLLCLAQRGAGEDAVTLDHLKTAATALGV